MTGFTRRAEAGSRPFLMGVAGGSGSGKTYFARTLAQRLGPERCEIVLQDNFYVDQSHRFDHDGGSVNFDHPESIDFGLLAERLSRLRMGESVEIPIYDFATHKRLPRTLTVRATPVVIVDGFLILHDAPTRALFDERIFFDTPEELRYQRRLDRDVKERGRTPAGVWAQFVNQVKPMHDQFVEPSKAFADTVVQDLGHFEAALEHWVKRLGSE